MPKKPKIVDPNLDILPAEGEETNQYWLSLVRKTVAATQTMLNGFDDAKRAMRMFRGDHWSQMGDDRLRGQYADDPNDLIVVNVTRSNVKALLPFLVNREPQFIADPRQEIWIENGKKLGKAIDYHWEEFKMQKSLNTSVLWGIITGVGVAKTGFNYEFEELEARDPQKQGEIEYSEKIRKDYAFFKPVNRFKFIWDLDAEDGSLHTARWCAEIIFKDMADVMANAKYWKSAPDVMRKIQSGEYEPGTVASNMEIMAPDNAVKDAFASQEIAGQRKIVLFEIWDKKFKRRKVYIDNVPEPIIDEPHPFFDYLDGFPYAVYTYSEEPGEPFGPGLPFDMRHQQFELDRMRTLGMQHLRRFNRRYEVVQGMLTDDEQLESLQYGPDGSIVTVKAKGAINPIQDAPLSQDKYRLEDIVKEDIREMTGVDNTLKNAPLPSRTSATEIQSRVGIANAKIDWLKKSVDNFVQEIGTQLMQHIQANMETPIWVKIIGPEGTQMVKVSPDDVKGEFQCRIVTTVKPDVDPETQKQGFTSLFQAVVVPMAQAGLINNINFNAALKKLFEMNNLEFVYNEITAPQPVVNPQTGQTESTLPPQISPQQQAAQVNAVNPASLQQGPAGGL